LQLQFGSKLTAVSLLCLTLADGIDSLYMIKTNTDIKHMTSSVSRRLQVLLIKFKTRAFLISTHHFTNWGVLGL